MQKPDTLELLEWFQANKPREWETAQDLHLGELYDCAFQHWNTAHNCIDSEKALASDLQAFVKKYAKVDPNDPSDWATLDACLMEAFAKALLTESKPTRLPWSEWTRGEYEPASCVEGRKLHDSLIFRCEQYLSGKNYSKPEKVHRKPLISVVA
jgi:hypothetical protein